MNIILSKNFRNSTENIYTFLLQIQIVCGKFGKHFMEVLNKHAPIQNKKVRSKNVPWITRRIRELIISTEKLKRKAIITNLETDWYNYKC